jgi:hypothetical protein
MKKLKFINTTTNKNTGFSKSEINIIVKELNIQNDIFINYLEQAGKTSNIFNVNFLDSNQYINLQNEFRKLIENESEIDLKSDSLCYFNYTLDDYNNKYYYFIKTNEKLNNPKIFCYSNGEIPAGENFRDDKTKKIGLDNIKSDFIDYVNSKTESKFGSNFLTKLKEYIFLILFFPFWLLLLLYLEIKKRY